MGDQDDGIASDNIDEEDNLSTDFNKEAGTENYVTEKQQKQKQMIIHSQREGAAKTRKNKISMDSNYNSESKFIPKTAIKKAADESKKVLQ
jgi:hypothetical protein